MQVKVQGFSKLYGTQRAVDSLSFEAVPGKILGFLGPNGAGKSTTMKAITCFLQGSEGAIHVGDFDVNEQPLEVRKNIGYLPEHNPLYLDMYVREFLDFVGKTHKMHAATRKVRIEEIIKLTGLERESHKRIGALSKGYRQRVGLCQAIIHNPPVLILDEPTSGLDPNQMAGIRALIKDLGKDKTVIFSSHILSEVEAIADRVIIINQGKLVADSGDDGIDSLRPSEAEVFVRVAQEGLDIEALLASATLVLNKTHSPQSWTFTSGNADEAAAAIFAFCSEHQNPILELSPKARKLEDVFRAFTENSGVQSA
ncbi:MAG: ATP-binding cassette domain-containing protein [Bacteroidia bacterium]